MALSAADILNKTAPSSSEAKAIQRRSRNSRLYFRSGGLCKFNSVPAGCISIANFVPSQKKTPAKRLVDVGYDRLSPETPSSRLSSTQNGTIPKEVSTPQDSFKNLSLSSANKNSANTSIKRQRLQDTNELDSSSRLSSETQLKRPRMETTNDSQSSPETPVKRQRFQDTNGDFRLNYTWKGLEVGRLNNGRSLGLNNTRNDCFINSVLQFVFHTPQLIRYIQMRRNDHKCNHEKNRCIYCILNVYIDRICKKVSNAFTPGNLRGFVNDYFPNRIPNNQEDAHEMLLFLLSKLEPPLPKRSNQTLNTPQTIQLTEIDRIFGGKLCNQIVCKRCKHRQINKEQVRELNLNLNETQSFMNQQRQPLQRYIDTYFKVENLDDYKCDECKAKGSTRQLCIEDGPQILIIQLKRFRHNGSKNSIEIEIPENLDLKRYAFKDTTSLNYKLYGFISHCGLTPNSGHYKCTMRGYDSQSWFIYDDEDVMQTNPGRFDSRQPYLLFYYKVSQPQFTNLQHKDNVQTSFKNGNGSFQSFKIGKDISQSFKNGNNKYNPSNKFILNGNTSQQKQINETNGFAIKRPLGQPPSSSQTNGHYYSSFSNSNSSNGSSTSSPLKRPFSAETSNTNGYHYSQNGMNGKSSYHSQENGVNGKNKENNDEYRSSHHHYSNGHSHHHHSQYNNQKNRSHSFDNYSRYHH